MLKRILSAVVFAALCVIADQGFTEPAKSTKNPKAVSRYLSECFSSLPRDRTWTATFTFAREQGGYDVDALITDDTKDENPRLFAKAVEFKECALKTMASNLVSVSVSVKIHSEGPGFDPDPVIRRFHPDATPVAPAKNVSRPRVAQCLDTFPPERRSFDLSIARPKEGGRVWTIKADAPNNNDAERRSTSAARCLAAAIGVDGLTTGPDRSGERLVYTGRSMAP